MTEDDLDTLNQKLLATIADHIASQYKEIAMHLQSRDTPPDWLVESATIWSRVAVTIKREADRQER